ncbi:MAG: winged helix-turn-helix transcriptional regulator [Kiritimatiellae bacterium]|nr:winged helix-turn-helix transcriptional regulator [Kiritimatiellia bacterium]
MLSGVGNTLKSKFTRERVRCQAIMDILSLVSNKTRFQILCALHEDDFCVNELVEIVGGKISNVSQQLKALALAGIVSRQRDDQRVIYSLKDERVRNLLTYLQQQF